MIRTLKFIVPVSTLLSVLFLSLSGAAAAEPYAPLLPKEGASSYILFQLKGAEPLIPDKSEVPVPHYSGSLLFSVSPISSTSDTHFQMNHILELATTDAKDTVLQFYKGALSGWKHTTLNKGQEILLKTGDQKWWSGNKLLEGPRVEIVALTGSPDPAKMGLKGSQLKESNPEMNTLIRVFYETKKEPLMAVDVEAVMKGCIEKEIETKAKLLGGNTSTEAKEFLHNTARSTCENRVGRKCKSDPNDRNCQKYARLYS